MFRIKKFFLANILNLEKTLKEDNVLILKLVKLKKHVSMKYFGKKGLFKMVGIVAIFKLIFAVLWPMR